MTADMEPQETSRHPAAQKRKSADRSSSPEPRVTRNKRQCLTDSLCLSSSDDLKVMGTMTTRYEVLLLSVISSSKIQKRVSTILRHLTPPTQSSGTGTSKARISVLRAKATQASKLVSIAEIAKREIEKEQPTSSIEAGDAGRGNEGRTGRWFQYIALGEEFQQKQPHQGGTIIEDTVIGGQGADANDSGGDEELEVTQTPFERAVEGRPTVRGIPIMSLFLSRSSIQDLKRRYGEQTNALPMSGS
ncbi:hypothetical protein GGS21DRAFT_333086 [Xylaria nigripes]|nr:hypothetical protein GGS21DRAFT_333086 [Xylaria nigripes]